MSEQRPDLWRFLVVDQGIAPFVINFLLNAGIAWGMFHSEQTVPLWGQSSIAGDTLATAFILPLLTSLITGRLVARRVATGHLPPLADARLRSSRWVERSTARRGAAVGALSVLAVAVPTVALFAAFGPEQLGPWPFVWFKATFAALLGVLVTPLLGWWALVRASCDHDKGLSASGR